MNEAWLAHHGIAGQRWGHRNGPPYPLHPEDHDASERKAGWRKSLDNATQVTKNKIKKTKDAESVTKTKDNKSITKTKVKLTSKQLKQFAKDSWDYDSGNFEKWYNKGILEKKINEVYDTRSQLTSLLTDKEKKEILDHLNKANDLTQKLEEHEKHMQEARRIGKDAANRIMGAAGNQKLDRYGNTVSQSIAYEMLEMMKMENKWVDEWYKEEERLEELEARGIKGKRNKH